MAALKVRARYGKSCCTGLMPVACPTWQLLVLAQTAPKWTSNTTNQSCSILMFIVCKWHCMRTQTLMLDRISAQLSSCADPA